MAFLFRFPASWWQILGWMNLQAGTKVDNRCNKRYILLDFPTSSVISRKGQHSFWCWALRFIILQFACMVVFAATSLRILELEFALEQLSIQLSGRISIFQAELWIEQNFRKLFFSFCPQKTKQKKKFKNVAWWTNFVFRRFNNSEIRWRREHGVLLSFYVWVLLSCASYWQISCANISTKKCVVCFKR